MSNTAGLRADLDRQTIAVLDSHILWRAVRWFYALLLFGVLAVDPVRAELLEDLGAPQLFVQSEDALEPAVLTATEIDVDIVGEAVSVELRQVFANPRDAWVDALYALPVPDGAAVQGLTLALDGRRIVGRIREREEAREVYVEAAAAGQRAGLLEQYAADLFHLRVANIPPDEAVTVTVSMTLGATREGDWWSVRFPTTLTSRYRMDHTGSTKDAAGESGEPGKPRKQVKPGEYLPWLAGEWQAKPVSRAMPVKAIVSPEEAADASPDAGAQHALNYRIGLRAHGRLGQVITPLHDSRKSWRGRTLEITPRASAPVMDRDLLLRWRLRSGNTPESSVLLEDDGTDTFAELMLLPPARGRLDDSLPRDLVLVLDVSGSMSGQPIEQAVAAAQAALDQLSPDDRFDLITFESDTTSLFGDLITAAPDALAVARQFLSGVEARGGTEMLPALQRALAYDDTLQGALRQVLFITDGAVYGEAQLFEFIANHLGRSRLFTVGIGSAPNTRFMRRAAMAGRGLYRHVADLQETRTVLANLLEVMATPILTDVVIDWPMEVEAVGAPARDLYRDEPVRQRVRLLASPTGGAVTVTGLLGGEPWQQSVSLPAPFAPLPAGRALAARWAQTQIDWLLDEALVTGRDQASVRGPVLALGLDYQLVTPFSSFVAVEEQIVRPPWADAGEYRVPTLRPAGQAGFAQTATPAGLWLYGGLVMIVLAVLTWVMSREEGGINAAHEG